MTLFCDAREMTRRYGAYVADLRRLFTFHGLGFGAPEHFRDLSAKLAESDGFRADLSALARNIRDFEAQPISADEMLSVIAVASGGEALLESSSGTVATTRTILMLRLLLAGVGGWSDTAKPRPAAPPGLHRNGSAPETPVPIDPPGIAPDAGDLSAAPETASRTAVPPSATATDTTQGRLELAVTELKLYLDDIDRRIGRLEPHLEDITQALHTSPERFQRSQTPRALSEIFHPEPLAPQSQAPHPALAPAPEVLPLTDAAPAPPVDDPPVVEQWGTPTLTEPPSPQEEDPATVAAALSRRHRKERAGELLKIAAVLLAMVGVVGLGTMYLSPASGTPKAAGKAAQKPAGNPEPAVAATPQPPSPFPDIVPAPVQQPSAAAPAIDPTQPSAAPPPVESRHSPAPATSKPASTGEPEASASPALNRVAGKRAEMQPAPPRIEEPPTPDDTLPRRSSALPSSIDPKPSPTADTPGVLATGRTTIGKTNGQVIAESESKTELVSASAPAYPAGALRQGTEARVVLNALIGTDGTVRRMDVVEGAPGFNRSAIDAISSWRYRPHLVNGKPVEVQRRITLTYRLH